MMYKPLDTGPETNHSGYIAVYPVNYKQLYYEYY